jgi:hypothetical protein
MTASIEINSRYIKAAELKRRLEEEQSNAPEVSLHIHGKPSRFRGGDPNVLIALVGLAGGGLGALITGLMNIAAQRQGSYVELKGPEWSVRVPAKTTPEELNKMVEMAKSKHVSHIQLLD